MSAPDADHPNVIAFPPLLFSATLVAGALLHLVFMRPLLPALPARIAGGVLAVACVLVARTARRAMKRAGTNVNPREPSLAIVSDGPFRVTRNPLYLCLIGFYLAGTLLVDGVAPLVLLPPLLGVLHYGIILREERYLEAKFGDAYRAYRVRVRRYL